MGSFDQWVMVRAEADANLRAALGSAEVRGEFAGWTIAKTSDVDPVDLVAELVRTTHAPALGGWIYDSDFAFVTALNPDGSSFEVVIGKPYETGDADETNELESLADEEGRRQSAHALINWTTKNGSAQVDVADVLRIIQKDYVFAEEGVAELVRGLGLPDPFPLL
jgi:hypothetical protein